MKARCIRDLDLVPTCELHARLTSPSDLLVVVLALLSLVEAVTGSKLSVVRGVVGKLRRGHAIRLLPLEIWLVVPSYLELDLVVIDGTLIEHLDRVESARHLLEHDIGRPSGVRRDPDLLDLAKSAEKLHKVKK